MNEYDKAGRYLIKRDPPGFFRWLLRRPDVPFHAWIDARQHALPDQGDLTNDLVAAFRSGGGFETLCVELQAASEGAPRLLLGYVPRLLTERARPGSLVLSAAGGAVVNLTGPEQPVGVEQRPTLAPRCWLAGGIEQRTLRDEDAGATIDAIATGAISRWLLAWLPLMQGRAEPGIIEAARREALKEPNKADLGVLAGLALTFARLAENDLLWDRGLEGIDVITSPYLEELREKVRALARAEGRVEALREAVLSLGRQRFGKAASRKQKARLNGVTDPVHLKRIHDNLLAAASWDDLLAIP